MTGKDLKHAIRGKGLTIQGAAQKLGMSRQALHYFLKKEKLTSDFLEDVSDKLAIVGDAPLTLSQLDALKFISEKITRVDALATVMLSGLSEQPEFLAALKKKKSKEGNEVLALVNQLIRTNLEKS